ncbi:nuclease-related domain-containing protein [Saliterribacillus persicus]|uniref:Nuclease-like protein n=1 Tax=Saliterribacillus persicus TaxID=930114 RepID=A0A368Y812_9BACI|nr:nuclease-related domain-containing protein [Saliterribacillus persicus]RCW74967.1 nuclease-like protein [Saliterribacillus persicus]
MGLFSNLFKGKEKVVKKVEKKASKPKKKHNQHIATRKGEIGEHKIDVQLSQFPKEYKYLNDLMIENKKAKSKYSQIDHLLITPYGIFVIETKNYQGTIYGGKDRKTWSVNGKFKMMNPFIQNYGHIEALKNITEKKFHSTFISVVSFTKRSTFKIDEVDLRKISSDQLLVYDIELSDFINRKINVLKLQHEEPVLTSVEMESLFQKYKSENIEDKLIRESHVNSLKAQKKEPPVTKNEKSDATCSICKKVVSEKVKTYCLSNKKFAGKVYCYDHQRQTKVY